MDSRLFTDIERRYIRAAACPWLYVPARIAFLPVTACPVPLNWPVEREDLEKNFPADTGYARTLLRLAGHGLVRYSDNIMYLQTMGTLYCDSNNNCHFVTKATVRGDNGRKYHSRLVFKLHRTLDGGLHAASGEGSALLHWHDPKEGKPRRLYGKRIDVSCLNPVEVYELCQCLSGIRFSGRR